MSTGERYVSRETIAAPGDHFCSHPEARRRLISVHVREGKATHNLSWSLTRKAWGGRAARSNASAPDAAVWPFASAAVRLRTGAARAER